MPKNNVTSPITEQEIAFAHLLPSRRRSRRSQPKSAAYTAPTLDRSESNPLNAAQTIPSQAASSVPRVPNADYFAPDTGVPFSIPRNPFARRR